MDDKKICASRGRPRGFCVDQATDTALRLFASRGYDGVGVAELAQAIGVSPPSLYAAFGSKRGLFERAVALYQRRFGAIIPDVLAEAGPPEKVVRALLRNAADAYTGNPDFRGCMVMDGVGRCQDETAGSFLATLRTKTRDTIRSRLAAGGAADPDLLADYVMTALRGLSAAARDGVPRKRLRAVADLLADGFPMRKQA